MYKCENDQELDKGAMEELKRRCMINGMGVEMIEKEVVESNIVEAVVSIGKDSV